ncbi:MAG: hypothetical protein P8X93_05245 [Gammaproteobacteria bacterium]
MIGPLHVDFAPVDSAARSTPSLSDDPQRGIQAAGDSRVMRAAVIRLEAMHA